MLWIELCWLNRDSGYSGLALARPLSIKSMFLLLNYALARSLSLKSTFWSLKLSSGSTPVDESNVFECPEGFKRRGPGADLGASIHKSIESNVEIKEFREEVPNEAWEL